MTSKSDNANEAFIWVWLPKHARPVVAGKLECQENRYVFTYGKSYRERKDAIALSPLELPLQAGVFEPEGMRALPACLRDALPDAWGRRLIDMQYPRLQPNELDYGLLSGSDRIGALDFQASSSVFEDKYHHAIRLSDINAFAKIIESGNAIPPALIPVIQHGTSIGGARPKCLIEIDGVDYIAKFSLSADQHPLIRYEFLGMQLANLAGIQVAETKLTEVSGRDVLLIKRFDRYQYRQERCRHLMLSGLSLLGLDEMEARYASYLDLADVIRARFNNPKEQLHELFRRLAFNVLVGNTDDHARNHSAFWDGKSLVLTPAYDLCPQFRAGSETRQAMKISGDMDDFSTFSNVLSVAGHFLLTSAQAKKIISHQIAIAERHWSSLALKAKLNKREQTRLWGVVICSEFAMQGW
ncbi:MAG: phosphatidylinositol kinase [Gammaproteobacteria bacterium RIFCSPLOWO2_02_FULL_42_14]|nr:MAG: phosphatidylinositol kinase [Gammaproteobacteria bacterium RIFCSPHIGHO2_02_FULL_42_43]OGT27339.1 MAG: phosphatidylinositol kinase [Gammaproteobacteria bacterium RIFCSPHIGHO2_01_FULL_42_8]OGT53136.1 MAG: phosphatidylinositol kinase [Gammaproteobacteria bacterium RIFCSPHIGHO2_12_FULL_41_25]OGT61007.1 MAG: phosphatidylinositol kinase [Gammaproteobacteria bacterium RIFCSPLOWO2_02_FULL_42_14]OGT85281.1 MAG: phosphatidylinositol kinase [Gammaproteobacteria bacterium RIFCSPLOWO2_12_FULL_42_18]